MISSTFRRWTFGATILMLSIVSPAISTTALSSLALSAPARVTDSSTALLNAWRINLDGRMGAYTLTNGQTGLNLANVQLTQQNASNVYVHASGIPEYSIGPFGPNPAIPNEQGYRFRFSKTPGEQQGTKQATGLGPIGVLVNGVPIYNSLDAFSWSATLQQDAPTNGPAGQRGDGIWNRNANVVEAPGFDSCGGHPAPGQTVANGRYHNHADPVCLRSLLGDDGTHHSPVIGWAFDGYPLYGPSGYADPLSATSTVRRLTSSYRLRSITQRTTLPDGTALAPAQYGPDVSAQYPLGYYVEDFEYVQGMGDLDRYNGRFMVTPEFPAGTYAYAVSLTSSGASAYPYLLGPQYFGVVAVDNFGAGQVTIPADVTTIAPQKRYIPTALR